MRHFLSPSFHSAILILSSRLVCAVVDAARPSAPISANDPHYDWPGYYLCDDLVPPLCDGDLELTTGTVMTGVRDVQIQYFKYSNKKKASQPKLPVFVVNGGPGLPHNVEKPTRSLACEGNDVIMYDQAGTGASNTFLQVNVSTNGNTSTVYKSIMKDYPELMELSYYAEKELPALIEALGYENYHVMGDSWGTQIAFHYAAIYLPNKTSHHRSKRGHRSGLQSLILNAPISDNRKFIEYQWNSVEGSIGGSLPLFLQQRLLALNETQNFTAPEYFALSDVVTHSFVARLQMPVDCWIETVNAGINGETAQLAGVSDIFLTSSGHINHWTVLPYLNAEADIARLPIQLNYGAADMVRPRLIADTTANLEAVECNVMARAGHSVLLDAPAEVYPKIRHFLERVQEFYDSGGTGRFANDPDAKCPTHDELDLFWYGDKKSIPPGSHYHHDDDVHRSRRHHFGNDGDRSILHMPAGNLAILLAIVVTVSVGLGILIGNKCHSRSSFKKGYEMIGSHAAPHSMT
jgi:pimeloyl-ACP methyl ester carboxylesterase